MSKEAQNIEAARRAYVAAMGTPNEKTARVKLELAIARARTAKNSNRPPRPRR